VDTQGIMNFANAHNFVFGANYHGGAEVVNYPWDYTYTLHPDDDWFISSSLVYASNVQDDGPAGYFTSVSANGITNGADWYVISGGRQDWMNYTRNGREVTIECSLTKLPAAFTMPNFWNYNYEAMLSYLEQSLYGIHAQVKDAWGNPLAATVTVVGHDNLYSISETDPSHGDFYRYLAPGTYNLLVETAGYPSQTVPVTVLANQKTPLIVIFGELPNTQQISLDSGWNLISLNVQPSSYDVEDVFAGLSGLLQVKDSRLSYAPLMADYFNTLGSLSATHAYWVNMASPATLNITGPQIDPASLPIELHSGWNLVSYLPDQDLTPATALASIASQLLEIRHLADDWSNRETITLMQPGKGYWIKVSAPCTLIYP